LVHDHAKPQRCKVLLFPFAPLHETVLFTLTTHRMTKEQPDEE
jgi:hypothetical protein